MKNNKQNFYYFLPTLIGKNIIIFITLIGNITSFLIYALYKAIIPPFYIKQYVKQIYIIGWASLPSLHLQLFLLEELLLYKFILVERD